MNLTEKHSKEQLPTSTIVDEKISNLDFSNKPSKEHDELDYSKQYEDSVIWIRGRENIGYFGTIGMRRITDIYETSDEINALLKGINWSLLLNVVTALVTEMIASIELTKEELKAQAIKESNNDQLNLFENKQ